MREGQPPEATVEVLLFRVGAARFGADASQVVRVARASERTGHGSALGPLDSGTRALVFRTPEGAGEAELCVDEVQRIRPVPISQLRRVPPAAGAPRGVIGFYLEAEDRPLVLVDLPQCLDFAGGQ
jgi:chemotaxis signal transduction protein